MRFKMASFPANAFEFLLMASLFPQRRLPAFHSLSCDTNCLGSFMMDSVRISLNL